MWSDTLSYHTILSILATYPYIPSIPCPLPMRYLLPMVGILEVWQGRVGVQVGDGRYIVGVGP